MVLIFVSAGAVSAQTTPPSPVPLPSPFTPIVDNANVIDAATRQRLESIYLNLKERGNIEYAVLTVDTTGDLDIFDFSLRVARGWGIGPKEGDQAGFLLVVAIQDRKYFTQVSRHIEGDGMTTLFERAAIARRCTHARTAGCAPVWCIEASDGRRYRDVRRARARRGRQSGLRNRYHQKGGLAMGSSHPRQRCLLAEHNTMRDQSHDPRAT